MNYKEAYEYLNTFTNYEQLPGVSYLSGLDNLTRVDLLMRLLGNPQSQFPSIVVAGTKGKGSVAAMLESVLRNQGLTTGLYTSPHLHTFRERIRVGEEMIPPSDVVRIIEQYLAPAVERIKALGETSLVPTTYELATALAFLYFRERTVDLAVLEVGLGGRLDAVNIARPLVSVITPISMDHMQVLGDTLEQIAQEKAGIIKPRGVVVSAPQPREAATVIRRVAAAAGADLQIISNDVYISTQHLPEVVADEQGIPVYQAFTVAYRDESGTPGERIRVRLPLLGSHQQLNAAVALAALRALSSNGIEVDRRAIVGGLESVVWPGRLEIVRREPVVVLDGAHNPESMARLTQAMHDLFYGRKLIVVIGISRDKDLRGIFDELGAGPGLIGPRVEKVIVTRSRHGRAAYPTEVAERAQARGLFTEIRESVPEALMTAVGAARAGSRGAEDDPVVLVTGSLFVVAEARQHFGLAPDLEEEQS